VFGKAADDVIATFLERKVYWETKLKSNSPSSGKEREKDGAGVDETSVKVWIGDPTDAQYLESTPGHLLEVAGRLVAGDGLVRMEGEWAAATAGLMGQGERIEGAMRMAVEELERKHAFERG